ncbi:MAG: non-homologous end-joining DNA ligase [Acidobacteria bacterium]|nr:non-homologous end-joining DNA ligase [Acidobacteriota bacterium]
MSSWRGSMADVKPMLASLDEPPVTKPGLVYEPKYDGIRALAALDVDKKGDVSVSLFSRNGKEKHAQFPAITEALADIGRKAGRPLLIDGEVVAIDSKGRPLGFQHIQGRIHLTGAKDIAAAERAQPAVFIAFDLIRDADEDLRGLPFAARRLRLQDVVPKSRRKDALIRLSDLAIDDGRAMLQKAKAEGWEGLIVKEGNAPYHSGKRTPAWRKLKLLSEQEFVVGGWTEPRETRQHFGSLLLGYYDKDKLVWAGHVGTGFTQADLDRIAKLLKKRERRTSPFAGPVKPMETPHWVDPDLVAQVRFIEWTSDGLLRQPVFLGLRDDKPAKEITRDPAVRQMSAPAVPAPKMWKKATGDGVPRTRARSVSGEGWASVQSQKRGGGAPRMETKSTEDGRRATESRKAASRQDHPATNTVVNQLHDLEDARRDGDLALPNGDTLRVTNLAKLYWPDLKITKGDLLRYYAQVAHLILPVVDDRPLVMRRFPNGVTHHAFYQQKHPEEPPPGVRRETLPPDVEDPDEDGPRERLIGGSITTLLYMTQLAAISQDPWFSRVSDPHHQDFAAIDLDPGDDVAFEQVLDVARWVKDELDRHGIPAAAKTSGASGLHIYIRLPPETTYDTGQLLCRMVATAVATAHPKQATIERMVKRRPKKTVYVDFLQNILGKTLACAYSARASDYAGVSTPLTWKDVDDGVDPRDFTIRTAPERFESVGDLWGRFLKSRPVDLHAVINGGRSGRRATR